MTKLELHDLSKTFPGGAIGLDGVDLAVEDGEFVVLVGPSGCGKSTLLRIVAGLEEPTRGTVSIDGVVVDDLPPKGRDIAMVFQNYALYPHLSVEANLAFSLRIRRLPRAEVDAQVRDVAHVLALEPLLKRKPAALSGGQRQRVAMGRAMVRHPRVLLMDEPLSNLDAKLRVAMRGELMRLHQEHRTTTLYVTHDQVEAMTLGDRIAVLDQGRLQQIGTPDELYRSPSNVFVAGFIGSPAMNLARAEVVDGVSAPVLKIGRKAWPLPLDQARRCLGDGDGPRSVIVGWRPSAVELRAADAVREPGITVEAITVEALGDEKNVLFLPPFSVPDVTGSASAETELTAMWTASVPPSSPITPGDRVHFGLDLERAYFFDGETGLALAAEPAANSRRAAPVT